MVIWFGWYQLIAVTFVIRAIFNALYFPLSQKHLQILDFRFQDDEWVFQISIRVSNPDCTFNNLITYLIHNPFGRILNMETGHILWEPLLVTVTSSCFGIQIYIYSLSYLLILICCNQNKTNKSNAMSIPYYTYCKHDLLKQSQALHKTSGCLSFVFSLQQTC